jgi:hypothetical protein
MEREEARRGSSALATKESFIGRGDEIENARPRDGFADDDLYGASLGEMLTSNDQPPAGQDSRRLSTRQAFGKVGTKISRLPSLGQNSHPNGASIENEGKG